MKSLPLLLLAGLLSGCALFPKPVEYFQDRVKPLPEIGPKADESLRQAAQLAAARAYETEKAALLTQAAPEVVRPAADTAQLTSAVTQRLGAPAAPWQGEIDLLLARMDAQEARYRSELDSYRREVSRLAGQKIEGSGLIQVGYLTHLLILAGILLAAWVALRIVATLNAPVAVGLRTVQGGSRFLGRALAEIIEGGQEFKNRLRQRLADQPDLVESILSDFRAAHQAAQSRDTKRVILGLKR